MTTQNWKNEVTAGDYFNHQKRRDSIESRRPAPRKPSDLGLGPGISSFAVRISDYDDVLATYNGFFSAEAGTTGAPEVLGRYVIFVASDAALGGVQLATNLTTNIQYRRTFTRSPSDPNAVSWSSWVNSATS